MKTDLQTESDPVKRALASMKHVHRAFGAPGNYGYHTKEGKALFELYEAHNDLSDFQEQREAKEPTKSAE